MHTRTLGRNDPDVSALGLGCMGLSAFYGNRVDDTAAIALIHQALDWVLAQGEDLVPIPGTRHPVRLRENLEALDIQLSAADLVRINAIFPPDAASGARYPEAAMRTVVRSGHPALLK